MIANNLRRFLALGVVASSLFLLPAAFGQTKNLVYTNGNIPTNGSNAVYGFSNDGAGNLTPLPGSPYATGGTGVAFGNLTDHQWDSDSEIIANKAGTLMFAVNGHSNTISVFNINADGSLSLHGNYFSGGPQPASIALRENFSPGVGLLVVVNKDSDPGQTPTQPNYTSFNVAADGTLTINAASTLNMPVGSSLAQALMLQGAAVQFFGVEFLNSTLANYSVKLDKTFKQNSSVTPPFTIAGVVLGAVVHPILKYVYVAQPAEHKLNAYKYDIKGILTFVHQSGNSAAAVCWLAINTAGTRIISAETPSHSLTVYDSTHGGSPIQIQRVTVTSTTGGAVGSQPAHLRYDPTGNFLYILDRNGYIHVTDVNPTNGNITESRAPFAIGTAANTVPIGFVVMQK